MSAVIISKDKAVFKGGLMSTQPLPRRRFDYFGKTSGNNLGNEAFIVDVHNRTIQAHCHPVDQFQVLLGAPGAFYQRTPIPDLMVQYADAYSVYGPIIGAETPMRLFTIRAEPSNASFHMPEDRDAVPYFGKRHGRYAINFLSRDEMPSEGETATSTLIERDSDGLGAQVIAAGPNTEFAVQSSANTSGQFTYVVAGEVEFEGQSHGAESLCWQEPDDEGVSLQAGSAGCQVVVMSLPYPTTRSVSEAESEKPSSQTH